MTNDLSANALTKRYRSGVTALDALTLTVEPHAVTALVGPNGAGKSTLMRTWMGFERPTSGTVSVAGFDPWRAPEPALSHVAYLAQVPSLYKELTVSEHLDLVAHFRASQFDREGAAERLDKLRIGGAAKAGALSGGQAAQLGLTIAIAMRAQILLLDEPLAHLDPLARHEFLTSLKAYAEASGATVVLSSHLVSDIEKSCDSLILLAHGMVVLSGRIDEIVSRHRAEGVARATGQEGRGGLEPESVARSLEDIVLHYLRADVVPA